MVDDAASAHAVVRVPRESLGSTIYRLAAEFPEVSRHDLSVIVYRFVALLVNHVSRDALPAAVEQEARAVLLRRQQLHDATFARSAD